jgi:hypothetical protein
VDLIRQFAFPLPAIVIAGMLGVPAGDRDLFKSWSDDITALVFGGLDDPGRYERAGIGMRELVHTWPDGRPVPAEPVRTRQRPDPPAMRTTHSPEAEILHLRAAAFWRA